MKICRVLRMNRGNAVLLGLGGSGRQTLTCLSIHIMGQEKINLEITKGYTQEKWKDDARRILQGAAIEGRNACLVLSETHLKNKQMMQDIDSLLNMGEIPNLYNSEEFVAVEQKLKELAKKEGNMRLFHGVSNLE